MIKITANLPFDTASVRLLANPEATMTHDNALQVVGDMMAFSAAHRVKLGVSVKTSGLDGFVFINVSGTCELGIEAVRDFLNMIRTWQSCSMLIEVVCGGRLVSHAFHSVTKLEEEGFTNIDELKANLGVNVVDAYAEGFAGAMFSIGGSHA